MDVEEPRPLLRTEALKLDAAVEEVAHKEAAVACVPCAEA